MNQEQDTSDKDGLSPSLEDCVICGTPHDPDADAVFVADTFFARDDGSLICASCWIATAWEVVAL